MFVDTVVLSTAMVSDTDDIGVLTQDSHDR